MQKHVFDRFVEADNQVFFTALLTVFLACLSFFSFILLLAFSLSHVAIGARSASTCLARGNCSIALCRSKKFYPWSPIYRIYYKNRLPLCRYNVHIDFRSDSKGLHLNTSIGYRRKRTFFCSNSNSFIPIYIVLFVSVIAILINLLYTSKIKCN